MPGASALVWQNGASVLLHGTSLSAIRASMNLFKQQLVIAFKTFHHHAANNACSCIDFPAQCIASSAFNTSSSMRHHRRPNPVRWLTHTDTHQRRGCTHLFKCWVNCMTLAGCSNKGQTCHCTFSKYTGCGCLVKRSVCPPGCSSTKRAACSTVSSGHRPTNTAS